MGNTFFSFSPITSPENPVRVTKHLVSNFLVAISTYARSTGTVLYAMTTQSPPPLFETLQNQMDIMKRDTDHFLKKLKIDQKQVCKNDETNEILAEIYSAFQNAETSVYSIASITSQQQYIILIQIQKLRDSLIHVVLAYRKNTLSNYSICH